MSKVVHFEIPVEDSERATRFYSDVFGWSIQGWGDAPYWLVTAGPDDEQGANGALIGRSEIHASPIIVIDVADIDAALDRASEAGAETVAGKQAVDQMGWSAYVRDPEGNVIGIWQSSDTAG